MRYHMDNVLHFGMLIDSHIAPLMDPLITRTIDNKYLMEHLLGKGGMGSVYMALHTGTKRSVAVKVIAPQYMRNRELLIRFQREAEATGRLRHPNVVNVTDFGVTVIDSTPVAYLVMEYLDGETLQDFLQRTPIPPTALALEILEQVALGITEAHSHGILHRDLKPQNIWLQPDGRGGYLVKVLDFGIAKLADPSAATLELPDFEAAPNEATSDSAADANLTDANATQVLEPTNLGLTSAFSESSGFTTTVGATLGTPAFMAPEQCCGQAVNEKSDLYSLAMIAYLMFAGELPFKGNARELIEQQTLQQPDPPHKRNPNLGVSVSRVILESLAKKPEDRAPSLVAFTARLRAVVEGEVLLLKESRTGGSSSPYVWMLVLLSAAFPLQFILVGVRSLVYWLIFEQNQPEFLAALVFLTHFSISYAATLVSDVGLTAWIVATRQEDASFRICLRSIGQSLRNAPRAIAAAGLTLHPVRHALAHIVAFREGLPTAAAQARSAQLLNGTEHIALALVARRAAISLLVALYVPAAFTIAQLPVEVILREYLGGGTTNFLGFVSISFLFIYGSFLLVWNLLYERCLRSLGQGGEVSLKRFEPNKGPVGKTIRLGTRVWLTIPLALLAFVLLAPLLNWNERFSDSLSSCALEGRYADAETQLKAGVKPDGESGRQRSPLTMAAQNGDFRLAELLIRYGAKLDAPDTTTGPIHYAVLTRRPDMVKFLLDKGANPNAFDNTRDTPLMLAAKSGQIDIVRLLLARGANPTLKDRNNRTALMHARQQNHPEVAALLTP